MNLLQEVENMYSKARVLREENPLLQSLTFVIPDVPLESIKEANVPEGSLKVNGNYVSAQFADYDSIPGFYINVFAHSEEIVVIPAHSFFDNITANTLIPA